MTEKQYQNDRLLNPEEVGELLRIPMSSVYDLSRKGKIPGAFKVGRHWRFSEKSIHDWLNGEIESSSDS